MFHVTAFCRFFSPQELGTVVKCTADSEEDYTDPVPEAAKMPDSKFNWLGNITATELGSFSHRQVGHLKKCKKRKKTITTKNHPSSLS